MFPVGDSGLFPVEGRKKRHHPDGLDLSSSSSKRYYTGAQVEQDSSIHSDAGTVTCLGSAGKVQDRQVWRKRADDAVDRDCRITSFSASEVSSTSAGLSSSVDCLGDVPVKEPRELCHNGKSKGDHVPIFKSSERRRLDADLEVNSEVTLQSTGNIDRPVISMPTDNEPSGESVACNVMYGRNKNSVDGTSQSRPENYGYRQPIREGNTQHFSANTGLEIGDMQWRERYNIVKICPSIADESWSSCGEPSEDWSSEEQRLRHADTDTSRSNRESLMRIEEADIQSAGYSSTRGDCAPPLLETNREWEDYFEVRSAKSSKIEVFKDLERGEQAAGHDGDEDGSQFVNEKADDNAHRLSYVLSSGRLSQEEVARLGKRPPTIDRDFEEYFSALML